MAEAAVTFLLENVGKLLREQINLISGAEKELKALQNELELMKAFLMESANKREKGEVFVQFGKQIRDAVYEAEDTLDACLTLKAKGSGRFGLKSLDLAKRVKELLKELQPWFQRAMAGLNALPVADACATGPGTSDDKHKKTQLLREDNVVGFADQEATLIKYLKQQTEELDVISIVGMPGLGKTTLAWKIYRDPKIEFEFPTLIWVYVSQEFNARDVYLSILKKFTNHDMSSKDNLELIQLVRSHLDKGRFLILMDDVWTVGDWKQIEVILPKNNKLGKVLITSRYEEVAKQANRNREPHKLRFMLFEESWELIQLEVFGRNNTCPKELEGLGMQIARQCGGVPLAVVVIGGILVEKCVDRRDLWEKVSDSVSAYLRDDEEQRTENIISLSYNKLPHYLRDCFLYLGMFPKDTEIPAWKLTRLWIAEGFVQASTRRSLEEVAEDKLNDLVARNLVMVEKTKANGNVKTCRVHDMIREFCQNEAAFANKNLFQEVKMPRQGVFDPAISEIVKRRRLCIHSNVIEFLHMKPKGPGVRSFVCFSKETITLPTENTSSIPEAFDLLRVIDVNHIKFTKFPLRLTKLMHLKYIALSGNEIEYLPEAVSKLCNLQTVKIDTTSREFEIKVDISKMMQLRHFKTKAAICLKELKGGGGENLQTLSRLSAKCCTEDLFNRASNLRNLGIRGNLTKFVDENHLEKLERLEKLKLVHDVFPATAGNPLHCLPDQHSFPPNLRILTLSSTYLDWQHMTTLGSLDNLEVLNLKKMAFKGRLWEAQGGGFHHLESLHIAHTDLQIWSATSDPFPKLKNLILKSCERLEEIPSQVGKNLQLVEIECVMPSLVKSAQKIKEEKQQMQDGQLSAKMGGFQLKVSPGDVSLASSSSIDDIYKAPQVRETNVVGFEDEADKLKGYLSTESDELEAISIVGMPGLGKTTVAGKIFRDPEIQYEFPTRIWVYVSQEFKERDIFLAILKELTTRLTDEIKSKSVKELAEMVVECLEPSKFLLVMDDVWSCEDWDKLQIALPKSNKRGKVLITSRQAEVGWHVNRRRGPHMLRFLTLEESCLLLQLEVFQEPKFPPELEIEGRLIAERCDGLPLAIVVIGGILVKKFSGDTAAMKTTWQNISESFDSYVMKDENAGKKLENIIILLSYEKLPHHLRECFLYFGMFPEDFEISAWKLIRLWIAEGLIQQKDVSLEETAENYLEELINRNLVRADKFKSNGKVKTCRIHDILRYFCLNEAGKKGEGFLQEIKLSNHGGFQPSISGELKFRRLCIHSNVLDLVSRKPYGPSVRSFVCFSRDETTMPPGDISAIPGGFKLLRVLDIQPIKFTKLPNDMFKLLHLKYLVLSVSLKVLPCSFSKLLNIQTLVVVTDHRTLDMKADILSMTQLRHFKTYASTTLPKISKSSKGASENIQTLGTIAPESCTEDFFDRARNLKRLRIRGKLALLIEDKSGSFESLGNLSSLEELKLLNDVFPVPPTGVQLRGLPPAYKFPPKLKILTLSETALEWRHMAIIGSLDKLEVLKLKEKAFQGEIWEATDGGFRHLEVLHIGRTNLKIWVASHHHFPRLKYLELKNCEDLLQIPVELAQVPSFVNLDLFRSKRAAASARSIETKIKQDSLQSGNVARQFRLSIFPPKE